MLEINNLKNHLNILVERYDDFNRDNYIFAEAAEAVNQGFDAFLSSYTADSDDLPSIVKYIFLAGAHSSWIKSYIFMSSGHIDSGWSEIRRAIEYVCYAAKIGDRKERADLWRKQKKDENARKKFSGIFAIPIAYEDDKYDYLRGLIVAYDSANYYGAHGNFETFNGKVDNSDAQISLAYFNCDEQYICQTSCLIVILGFRILNAFHKISCKELAGTKSFNGIIQYADEEIKKLSLDCAKKEKGEISKKIYDAVMTNNKKEIDIMFKELIEKEKESKTVLKISW